MHLGIHLYMYGYECIYVCERDLSYTCVITIKEEEAMNLKDNKGR